jgi:hypothetical protein
MGCQQSTADKIIKNGADFLFRLKGNHGLIRQDVVRLFEKWLGKHPDEFDAITFASEANLVAGRVERRRSPRSASLRSQPKGSPPPETGSASRRRSE